MRNFFIPSGATPTAAHPFSDTFDTGEPNAQQGRQRDTPFDLRGAERLGPDWSDEFMAWVDEHKRYPEQAIVNGEDGDAAVQMTVDRYGRVTGVRVVQRSGSTWLDAGLSAMFRDARLPPFPPGNSPEDLSITFTMHYILER